MVLVQKNDLSADREMLEIMGLVDPILNFPKITNYRNNLIQKLLTKK